MSGVEMGSNISVEDDVQAGEKIDVSVEPPVPPAPPAPPVLSATKDLSGERVWILLEDNAEIPPTGQYIGLNGRGYILRPNEEAHVPVELLGILDDAKIGVPVIDPRTLKVAGWRERSRFPYRVVHKRESQRAA